MCKQETRKYSCGCIKPEMFIQCEELLGSNARCPRLEKVKLAEALHYCRGHLVEEGTGEIVYRQKERRAGRGGRGGRGE